MEEDSKRIKNKIAAEAYLRMGKYAYLLMERGATLRLVSSLMCMPKYGSVYKRLIDKNENMRFDNKRGVTLREIEVLAQFRKNYPKVAAAMFARNITERRWCCAYGIITDSNYADLSALTDPQKYEDNRDEPRGTIFALLEADFPDAFGSWFKNYIPAEVDPALYYTYEKTFLRGHSMHIFRVDSLKIKVMTKSYTISHDTYRKRLKQEIRIQRMIQLYSSDMSDESIKKALAWLPEDVSKTRVEWGAENQGEGHQLMRAAEIAHKKELDNLKKIPK